MELEPALYVLHVYTLSTGLSSHHLRRVYAPDIHCVNHRYISSEDKKKGGAKRASEVVIHRRKSHPHHLDQTISIPYRITDNPLRLSPSEWSVIMLLW